MAEETELKFRAVHKILVENGYEVLMAKSGGKVCVCSRLESGERKLRRLS